MKPFGIRAEQREYEQQYYGGYCSNARQNGLNPMSYVKFQETLRHLNECKLTKKERMKKLIELTQ